MHNSGATYFGRCMSWIHQIRRYADWLAEQKWEKFFSSLSTQTCVTGDPPSNCLPFPKPAVKQHASTPLDLSNQFNQHTLLDISNQFHQRTHYWIYLFICRKFTLNYWIFCLEAGQLCSVPSSTRRLSSLLNYVMDKHEFKIFFFFLSNVVS